MVYISYIWCIFTYNLKLKAMINELNLEITKAEIIYEGGWMLVFPKTGKAPLLFLEWVAYYNASQCPIHKIINEDVIGVRLNGTKQTVYQSAIDYINDNL